jgi:hypothetical protein
MPLSAWGLNVRIVMPLFQFGYLGKRGFHFSGNQLRIEKFDRSQDIPDIDLFSKYDVDHMELESWALVFDHEDTTKYKTKVNLLLLSFRIFSQGKPPFIKYRLCTENFRKCSRLTSTMTYIHEFESSRCTYTDEDLAIIDRGFVALTEMDAVSARCHNALYFLYLAFTSIHWIESFMFQMNALEAIFSKDEAGGATKTICGRVSSFLGSKEGATYEDLEDLYATRSDIVHGRIVVNEEPLENLKQLHKLQSVSLWCMKKILEGKVYLTFHDKGARDSYLAALDHRR